ncbi:hypothetical protein G6F37_011800 [Rhizopus arrhizus]|nr:hypothetical protein G6F38_011094 [Rhizopus arrhizus]KAG1147353.1 hypothetical protein G6F37_011800 [Rhizopus arrhizus]
MHHSSKQLQAGLATAQAEIRKLQQKNAFLRKQLALKPSITNILLSPSRRITSPSVSSLSRNPPTPSKRPPSPNNTSIPLLKIAKPKRANSQPSLTAITRQFSSPAEPTGFKLIHVPVRHRLSLPVESWIFIIQIEFSQLPYPHWL